MGRFDIWFYFIPGVDVCCGEKTVYIFSKLSTFRSSQKTNCVQYLPVGKIKLHYYVIKFCFPNSCSNCYIYVSKQQFYQHIYDVRQKDQDKKQKQFLIYIILLINSIPVMSKFTQTKESCVK